MPRIRILQAIGASLFVALFLILLLVTASQALSSRAGVHPSYTGVMLLAPPYQHQHKRTYEV